MENNQVKDMVNDLSVRNHQLQDEIARLKKMLSEIRPEDPTLRDTIARLERMVEDLRQRLKICQDELGAVTAENGALKAEVARSRDAYETLDQQHRSYTSLSKATGPGNCLCGHTHTHTCIMSYASLVGAGGDNLRRPGTFLKPCGLECARMPPTCVRAFTHSCSNKTKTQTCRSLMRELENLRSRLKQSEDEKRAFESKYLQAQVHFMIHFNSPSTRVQTT